MVAAESWRTKTTSAAWSWSRRQPFPYELGEKISELKELMHENQKRYVNIQIYQQIYRQISTMTNVVFHSELSR